MSTGKHISLEEARKSGQIDRFIKEHPSKADERFRPLLDAMTTKKQSGSGTSTPGSSDSCNGTQTP